MSSSNSNFKKRLDILDKKLSKTIAKSSTGDDGHDETKGFKKTFLGLLKDICAVIREADAARAVDFDRLLARADAIIIRAVEFAYGSETRGMQDPKFDFLPSFAHNDEEPFVQDDTETPFPPQMMEVMAKKFLPVLMLRHGGRSGQVPQEILDGIPGPWSASYRPHTNTSRLARYRKSIPTLSSSDSTPTARIIHQAQCEVASDRTSTPTSLKISVGGSCMALTSMGGWKNRDPLLTLYMLGQADSFEDPRYIEVGLEDTVQHSALDEDRKLVFVADEDRIKSYSWEKSVEGTGKRRRRKTAKGVHTMDSEKFSGPLVVLPRGRIVRAGKGSAALWNIDELETHGEDGQNIIGKKIDMEEIDTWRDEPDDNIEPSTGSAVHSLIKFQDAAFEPGCWTTHPSMREVMLAAPPQRTDRSTKDTVSCAGIDLEHGGKYTTRYIGHGGSIDRMGTSDGDRNVFVTACTDGIVRLYDVRHPLPVFSMGVSADSFCKAVVIAHPDGVPTVFTGAQKEERVSIWDVRAKGPVYELATGNNSVNDIAWDSHRNVLYAATECQYVDRMGRAYDYRAAKIPKSPRSRSPRRDGDADMESDEEEAAHDRDDFDDDGSDAGSDYDGFCWPKRAYHKENYYGYTFDAGEHRLYRYAFKANADIDITPPYGDVDIEGGSGW